MKKILVSLLAAVALATTGYSQILDTNSSPPVLGGSITNVIQFLSSGTNWMIGSWGIAYQNKEGNTKAGVGAGAFYKVNDYLLAGLRTDFLDRLYMVSGGIQLQAPLVIAGKVKLIPFGFANVATGISDTDESEPVVGIFGAGLAVGITKNLFLVGDVEAWTGFPGEQYRGGLIWKF